MLVRRLDTKHDMVFGLGAANFRRDAQACMQNVRTRLLLLQGEWFLDEDAGVPYLQEICVRPANLPLAESLLKQSIMNTPDIVEITQFSMELQPDTRRLAVSITVRTRFNTYPSLQVHV